MSQQINAKDLEIQNLFNVEGLVAVVTGGATGIGLMITQTLAGNGAKGVQSNKTYW